MLKITSITAKLQRMLASWQRAAWGCLLLILGFHAWSLLRYPAPQIDEAWLTSRAWSFISTGHQFGELDSGLAENLPGYWGVNQYTITALQSLALRIAGKPSLLAVRVLALAFGCLLLVATYTLAKRLFGKRAAWISVLLLALSGAFFFSAHEARYDILAAALGYAALALICCGGVDSFWKGLLAGILTGVAVETHFNSVIFIPPSVIILALLSGRRLFKKHGVGGYFCGGVIGLAYFYLVRIAPSPSTFFYLNSMTFGSSHLPPLLTNRLAALLQDFAQLDRILLLAGSTVCILSLTGLIMWVRTHTREGWIGFIITVCILVGMAVIVPLKTAQYAILLAPAIMLPAGYFLDSFLANHPPQRYSWVLSQALVWGLVLGAILTAFIPLTVNYQTGFQGELKRVESLVRPGERLMGGQIYWFGLYDHPYQSWDLLYLYPHFYPGKTLADAFERYKPDILIVEPGMHDLISDSIDPSSYWYSHSISLAEFSNYVSQHAQLIDTYPSISGGDVQIYRFDWSRTGGGE